MSHFSIFFSLATASNKNVTSHKHRLKVWTGDLNYVKDLPVYQTSHPQVNILQSLDKRSKEDKTM